MASIIAGYEYDVFISYRQKDNRSDQWVTNFVNTLQEELDATFKEDISIYFDANPHHGLQETYDVDGSLKEKVKCLVFVPIVSQTYCDPKAFAWQNEFLAFLDFAKHDEFGLDIKLGGGNVTKRVLPVRIHEIDQADQNLFEEQIGGVMRPVDFIYKTLGVNRPLRINEELPNDNVNHTIFRNQINKVANTIKEIMSAVKNEPQSLVATRHRPRALSGRPISTKTKVLAGAAVFLMLMAILYFVYPDGSKLGLSGFKSHQRELAQSIRSVAILPFENYSGNTEKAHLVAGMHDGLIGEVGRIGAVRVLSKTSTMQYVHTKLTAQDIAKELGVDALIEGSLLELGENIRIQLKLIDAFPEEEQVWGEVYDVPLEELPNLFGKITQTIAGEINIALTPSLLNVLEHNVKVDPVAYEDYLKGKFSISLLSPSAMNEAKQYFEKAIEIDSGFSLPYFGLSEYWSTMKQMALVGVHQGDSMAAKYLRSGFALDSTRSEAWAQHGVSLMWGNYKAKEAESAMTKAIELGPNNVKARALFAHILMIQNKWNEAWDQINRALEIDPQNFWPRSFECVMLAHSGRFEESINKANRLFEMAPNSALVNRVLSMDYRQTKDYEKAAVVTTANLEIVGYKKLADDFKKKYRDSGYTEALKATTEQLTKKAEEPGFNSIAMIVMNYIFLGDKENAVKWLIRAYEEKNPDVPYFAIRGEGAYNDLLKDDPKYRDLMQRIGLLHY